MLPDDRYEEWTLGPRRALREQRLALLAALAAAHERAGQPEDAVAALRKVLEMEPAHEPAHAGLMRLYAAAGRRDEALRQYARLQARPARGARRRPGRGDAAPARRAAGRPAAGAPASHAAPRATAPGPRAPRPRSGAARRRRSPAS